MSNPSLDLPRDSALIRKILLRTIPFCIVCFLLNFIDRTNIGMAESSMEKYIPDFNASIFTFGVTLFYIPYCLLELPSNLIQQKVGARRWIARIMISWGIVSTCFMFINNPHLLTFLRSIFGPWVASKTVFYTLRVLLGVAEAGFFPGVILYLSYWIPHRHRARATALFVLAQAIAQMIGNTCGGVILYAADKYHLPGQPWHWLFFLEGIPSILMGFVVLFFLTDKPATARWLTADERQRLADIMTREKPRDHRHSASEFMAAFKSPHTWILSIVFSMMVWGYFPVQSFSQIILKPVLQQAGAIVLAPAENPTPDYIVSIYLGFLTAIPFAAAAIVMLFFAHHSDKRNERKFHVASACLLMVVGLALSAFSLRYTSGTTETILAVTGLSLSAIGWFCSFAIFWSIPAQLLTGTAVAASVAVINSIANLVGNFGGPNSRLLIEDLLKNPAGKANPVDVNFWSLLLAAACALIGAIVAASLKLPTFAAPATPAAPADLLQPSTMAHLKP